MGMKINLVADGYRITGPKVDGSYSVTFSFGEYQQEEISKIFQLPQLTSIKVEVSHGEK